MMYTFNKTVRADQLQSEIQSSSIVTAIDHIDTIGTTVNVYFKAELSAQDLQTLETLVNAHTPVPPPPPSNEVKVTQMPDPSPFAQPTFRTKRGATADIISCEPNASIEIPYKLLAERYVNGGIIQVENAVLGDYIVAAVKDIDGIIPAPYRAATCENHPIVAQYIDKQWMLISPQGSVSRFEINTYPLTARITAGLYLTIEYFAVNSGSTRRIVVNYHLTQKL